MKAACLLYGHDLHYVDHLAPLAEILNIPVVTTEESIYEMLPLFYPNVKRLYRDYIDIHFSFVQEFDAVFYAFTKSHFQSSFAFAQDSLQKRLKTIWCPHGNSDKDNLNGLKDEEFLLLYGEKMERLLQKKNLTMPYYCVGNFRYFYYKKYQPFYRALLQQKISALPKASATYLYAPTWQDYEDNSSFEEAFPHLLNTLPENINLIVKLHPNTWIKSPFEVERRLYPYEKKKNLLILKDFTPIYPLLEFSDIYIGDMSSIGYDFLLFNKPMFFLNQKKSPLSECGYSVQKSEYQSLYAIIAKKRSEDSCFHFCRNKLYNYTFKKTKIQKRELFKILYG